MVHESGPLGLYARKRRTTANTPVACLFLRDTADLRSLSTMAPSKSWAAAGLSIPITLGL